MPKFGPCEGNELGLTQAVGEIGSQGVSLSNIQSLARLACPIFDGAWTPAKLGTPVSVNQLTKPVQEYVTYA